jgi:exosortase/archaeosortase family protein
MSSSTPSVPALPSRRTVRSIPARRGSSRMGRVARILAALILTASCVAAVFFNQTVRAVEASGAAHLLNLFISGGSRGINTYFLVWVTPTHPVLFQVTAECTVLIILIPLLLIAAVMIALTRTPWWRSTLAVAATISIVMIVNIIRLAFIGWATQLWGISFGYTMSHTFAGSLIGIIGFVLGLTALILIMGTRRRKKTIAPAGETSEDTPHKVT